MVDCYGRWTVEKNYDVYPKEKWCDYDYIAAWIKGAGYMPKTTIENLVKMIIAYYYGYLEDNNVEFYTDIKGSKNGYMVSVIDVSCFVEENGGLKEFDYEY